MSIVRMFALALLASLGLLAEEAWHGQVTVGRYSSLVYLRVENNGSCLLTVDRPLQPTHVCDVDRNDAEQLWFYGFRPGQAWRGEVHGETVEGTVRLESSTALDGATDGRFTLRKVPAEGKRPKVPTQTVTQAPPIPKEFGLSDYVTLLRATPGTTVPERVGRLDSLGFKLSAQGVRDLETLAALANTAAAPPPPQPEPPRETWKTRLSAALARMGEAQLERSRREREAQEIAREVVREIDRQTGITWYQIPQRTTWYSFDNGKTCIATRSGMSYVNVNCY